MVSKPDWLRKLEEEQSANLLQQNQSSELNASHQRILMDGAPKLWDRILSSVRDALTTCEIKGLSFNIDSLSPELTRIKVFKSPSSVPAEIMEIRFVPETYRIRVDFPSGRRTPYEFFFTVSNGRVSLRDEKRALPDDEGNDIADVVCERLLKPLLTPWISA